MSSIEEKFRSVNPVIDPDSAMDPATYSAVLQTVRRTAAEQEDRPRRRKGSQAFQIVAALLVLAAFLFGMTRQGTRSELVVAGGLSDVSVARTYIHARNRYDTAAAVELLSPDAAVVEYPVVTSAAELPDLFLYLGLIEESFEINQCSEVPREPGAVTCSYELANRLITRAAIQGILGTVRFEIRRGRITSIENSIDFDRYELEVLRPWHEWLNTRTAEGAPETQRFAFHGRYTVRTPRLDKLLVLEREINRYAPEGS